MIPLSRQQAEIAQGIADGLNYAEIAKKMNISIRTIHSRAQRIRVKTSAHTIASAVARCVFYGAIIPNITQEE